MLNIQNILSPQANDLREREILLGEVLNVSRSYLYAHPEYVLKQEEIARFQELYQRYQAGEPIAYILGTREFWSLKLKVTQDTLIPRPETELLVELALSYLTQCEHPHDVADLGTGSGAIVLALAKERPHLTFFATDISVKALEVAQENAASLQLTNIIFKQGSWCDALPKDIKFDLIISNPPYLAANEGPLPFEPKNALYSYPNGYEALQTVITQAKFYLKSGGYLFLEHGFQQAEKVRRLFLDLGYNNVSTYQDLAHQDRVTVGKWTG